MICKRECRERKREWEKEKNWKQYSPIILRFKLSLRGFYNLLNSECVWILVRYVYVTGCVKHCGIQRRYIVLVNHLRRNTDALVQSLYILRGLIVYCKANKIISTDRWRGNVKYFPFHWKTVIVYHERS